MGKPDLSEKGWDGFGKVKANREQLMQARLAYLLTPFLSRNPLCLVLHGQKDGILEKSAFSGEEQS